MRRRLRSSRALVGVVAVIAVALAITGTETLFRSVLFAWTALGAAFGPLLLATLWRGPIGPIRSFCAMASGFASAVVAYSFAETRGTAVERVIPFLIAAVFAFAPRRISRGS